MQAQEEKRELINGVFSSQEVKRVGTGTTTRKTIQKTFWFCEEQPDGSIEIQPLNVNFIRSGPTKRLSKDDFLAKFAPEPEMYVAKVYPMMREVNKMVARGERHRANGETFSAEMEFNKALAVDEDNVRANFGLGITYLERGEGNKAENIFERLVKLDATFEPEHKHLFNDFGINLRKTGMVDQAITYYNRALELSIQDENLHYNLARAYLEKKDVAKSVDCLLNALKLNPELDVAVKFLSWIAERGLVPEEKKAEVDALLAKTAQEA